MSSEWLWTGHGGFDRLAKKLYRLSCSDSMISFSLKAYKYLLYIFIKTTPWETLQFWFLVFGSTYALIIKLKYSNPM
jgi:hypothetical protein